MRKRKRPKGGLVEVSDLLEGALQALGAKGDFERFRVEKKCRELLGGKASQALAGVTLKGGTVRVAFRHSIWLNEVQFRKNEILRKLQEEFPEMGLEALSLVLSRGPRS